jgi:hypothetical protein
MAAPPATSGTFALLAALPTPCPALLALLLTSPTAWRTASTGLEPPLEPLLDPFELGAFAFELDDFERDDLGFAALAFDFGFADFVFAFDCDFGFCAFAFDFIDELAGFDAARFFALVSAIFPLSSGGSLVSLLGQVPNPLAANHAACG